MTFLKLENVCKFDPHYSTDVYLNDMVTAVLLLPIKMKIFTVVLWTQAVMHNDRNVLVRFQPSQ